MATQKKQAKKPAPSKKPSNSAKKSSTKRNRKPPAKKRGLKTKIYAIFILMVVCFGLGFFTYKTLDFIFDKNLVEQKVESPKKPKIEPKPTVKPPLADEKKDIDIKIVDSNKTEIKFDKNATTKIVEIPIKDSNKTEISYEEIYQNLEEFAPTGEAELQKEIVTPAKTKKPSGKPKLAIIIDDIATFEHARELKSIGLKLSPSIFPPNNHYKDSAEVAKSFEFYMIHLPTEAVNFNSPKLQTLTTKDSYESIEKRVKFIRENFKNAKFINNHTGSKFTSDEVSMDRLLRALKKYGFTFVDSRTIATTKAPKLAPKYDMPYIYRDVFIDNKDSISHVKSELKKAVDIAKNRGYAIAIGHPKNATFKALKSAKNDILKDVEVVYISEIYEYYK